MTEITVQDWAAYAYIEELVANESDDFRIEIIETEDESIVRCYDWRSGALIESFSTTDDPYNAVEAARYCQAVPLEERWAQDAREGR